MKLARLITILTAMSAVNVNAQLDGRGYPDKPEELNGDFLFDENKSFLSIDHDIPALSARVNDPSIEVTEFTFEKLPEFPGLGITLLSVTEFTENLRQKYTHRTGELESGYTKDDLNNIALLLPDLLNAENEIIAWDRSLLVEIGNYALGVSNGDPRSVVEEYEAEGMKKIITDHLSENNPLLEFDSSRINSALLLRTIVLVNHQNAQRGITYTELEIITNEITRFYRKRGVILARAYIPVQKVKNGVVELAILTGVLGDVNVNKNNKYTSAQLRSPFEQYIGKPVTAGEIEQELYILNSFPGLDVFGYFSAGEQTGETTLNLSVENESSWQLTSRLDNHGSRFTGDNRLYNTLDLFNPFGMGDLMSFGYLKSSSPLNSDIAIFQYRTPVINHRTIAFFSTDYNEFSISPEGDRTIELLDLKGVNTNISLGVEHQFVRKREKGILSSVALYERETKLESPFIRALPTPGERVQGIEFSVSMDNLFDDYRLLNFSRFVVNYGEFKDGVDLFQSEEFYKLSLDTSTLKFVDLPFVEIQSHIIFKTKWRYSETNLPAFEQMPIGGADAVRAFTVSDFSGDQAVYMGLEWYVDLPSGLNVEVADKSLNDILSVAIIADAALAQTINENPGGSDVRASLGGAGLLFQINWQDKYVANISFSKPVHSKNNDSLVSGFGDDADSIQTYVDFTIVFD